MTNRQRLVKLLNNINRQDAAALLPTDCKWLNRLDENESICYADEELLYSFNWLLIANARYWLDVYNQLKVVL